jgi:hypothetical protein
MKYVKDPDPKTNPPAAGDLIPYYFRGTNQPVLYNGIQVIQQEGPIVEEEQTYIPPLSAQTFSVPLPTE